MFASLLLLYAKVTLHLRCSLVKALKAFWLSASFFRAIIKKENIRIACAEMLMGRLRRVRFAALFGHAKGQRAELEPGRKSREYGGQLTGVFGFLFPLQPHQNPLEQGGGV